jgi:hypothetical protein
MSLIELNCNQCGHKEMMKEFCPLTGHRYGAGFEYVCPICRGTMEGPAEVEVDPEGPRPGLG